MTTENMKAFLELALEDEDLRNNLARLNSEATDVAKKMILEIAHQKNVVLTEQDIEGDVEKNAELRDANLSTVSGGVAPAFVYENTAFDPNSAVPQFVVCLFGHCIGK